MTNPSGETEFDPFELETERKSDRPRKSGLAWLALLLALLAAGASGYLWWLDWQEATAQTDQQRVLDGIEREQATLQQALQSLETRLTAAEQDGAADEVVALRKAGDDQAVRLESLEKDLDEGLARDQAMQAGLFDLQQSFAGLEATVGALTARSDSPGQRLDMYEVESLLRMASERLQLFGDVQAAAEALAMADQRLAAMEDPVYLPVRQRIARARQALAEVSLPDLVQLEGRLSALQSAIARWPFPGETAVAPEPETATDDGIWARFKRTLSGLVTVRRKTAADEEALTIGDQDYLRQGLWLQFETARLSMMRRDQAVYGLSLERADTTLGQYFDAESAAVQAAREEIRQLRQVSLVTAMPDVSAPWSQLRLLRRSTAEAEAAPAPAAAASESAAEPPDPPEDEDG